MKETSGLSKNPNKKRQCRRERAEQTFLSECKHGLKVSCHIETASCEGIKINDFHGSCVPRTLRNSMKISAMVIAGLAMAIEATVRGAHLAGLHEAFMQLLAGTMKANLEIVACDSQLRSG